MISGTCPDCGGPFVTRPGTELGLPEWYCPRCDREQQSLVRSSHIASTGERLALLVLSPPQVSLTSPLFLRLYEAWAKEIRSLARQLLNIMLQ